VIPFAHQQEIVDSTWNLPGYAFFWEPRTCKSLPQIMTALRLYKAGLISGVVILAPMGVHHDWAKDVIAEAIPNIYPDGLEHHILDWMSSIAGSTKFNKHVVETLKKPGLVFFCADTNSLTSQRLRSYIEDFIESRSCLLVLDESHYFKNPHAKRTRFIMRKSKKASFKRLLTGTPLVTPFDLWSQFYCLDPAILGERFVPFKTQYGIFEKKFFGPRVVNLVTGYKNLDDLKAKIAPFASWRTYDETFPDNPGVAPLRRAYFELSPEYRKAYNQLAEEYILQLEKGEVLVNNALVMMLRLNQVARGFVNTDNGEQPIPGKNHAIERLVHEVLERPGEKIVIWCRFVPNVTSCLEALTEAGVVCVRHDGQISEEQRDLNRLAFQTDPKVRAVVGTSATGGMGKDFSAGSTVIFYDSDFILNNRIQAFDRVRGVNQGRIVQQIDLCALNTVDERCLFLLGQHVDVISKIQDRSVLLDMLRGDGTSGADAIAEKVEAEESSLSEEEAADLIERGLKEKT
jgi:SNF2 family DNA or RNA helicase